MAMFLARIKRALNLGTKSITANGTYTASSDGYDGYSQVSVAVPDPPSITPNNATPVALTANSSVKPSANGYAIASYNNVTPSNSNVQSVGENDIVRFASTGKIVKDVIEETPSSLSPTYLSRNNIYKIKNNSGYLISEYFSKTPSDTNPPSVALMDIIQITGNSGYLYKTQQSSVDISNIIDVATTTTAQSTRKNAIYTVGISVINVKNASTGYAIRFYDSPTASTWFDSVSNSSNKNIDVSNYNVVYFDTASASAIVATVTVKS